MPTRVSAAVVVGAVFAAGAFVSSAAAGPTAQAHASPRVAASPVLGSWSAVGGGMDASLRYVRALAMWQDRLVAGGDFLTVAGTPVNYIAAWNGSTWSPFTSNGSPGLNDSVYALTVWDDTLVAGGAFDDTSAVTWANCTPGSALPCIAAWSGSGWTPLGRGLNAKVLSLAEWNGSLIAGGQFDDTGAGTDDSCAIVGGLNCVAQWNGNAWSGLGGGLGTVFGGQTPPWVSSLTVWDDSLVAGGRFAASPGFPGTSLNNVAAFPSASGRWASLGSVGFPGLPNAVGGLSTLDDTLVVVGSFASGPDNPGFVATLGAPSQLWSSIGAPANASVSAVAVDDTRGLVYVGGAFGAWAGAGAPNAIAAWDSGVGTWVPLQWGSADDSNGLTTPPFAGGNAEVFTIALDDSTVYAGGAFLDAGGVSGTTNIGRWQWGAPTGSNTVTDDSAILTGQGFVGVPASNGVVFGGSNGVGGIPATYSRASTTSITVTVPAGATAGAGIWVNGAGGWGRVGTYSPPNPPPNPSPPPAAPPGAPTEVVALPGDAEASISWSAPLNSGSFAITSYQVALPSGSPVCLASMLHCTAVSLVNGTSYSFKVRALNGAGWGPWSELSAPVTPRDGAAIAITGSRGKGKYARTVRVRGLATGISFDEVQAWLRVRGQSRYQSAGMVQVRASGSFRWSRVSGKKTYVYFTAEGTKSNRVVIRGLP